MVEIVEKEKFFQEKKRIKKLISKLFESDDDKIANSKETMEHLEFIFSQENNKSFLLLNIEDGRLLCMVNFLEYNNILKDWCLFSVFTLKEKRKLGLAKDIIESGLKIVQEKGGKRVIAGIEYDNIPSQKLHMSLNFKYNGLDWNQIDDGFPENHKAFIFDFDESSANI